MNIPDNYEVIFVQGGGSTQFAMIPLNLFTKTKKADFIKTGQWAKKAMEEAGRYGSGKSRVASSEDKTIYTISLRQNPTDFRSQMLIMPILLYNNTIYGTQLYRG